MGRLWFSNEVDDLKEAQYSEEVRQVVQLVFVGGHLRGLEIVCHCITQAIKRTSPSTVSCDAFQISIHSFKELCQFHFSCADSIGQWVGWRAQDGRWEKENVMSKSLRDTDEHTTYDFILAVCWLNLFFT